MAKKVLTKNLCSGDLIYGKKDKRQIEVWEFKGYKFKRVAKVDIHKVKVDERKDIDGSIELKKGEDYCFQNKLTDKDKRELKKIVKRIKIANSLEDEKTKTKSR